jgi:DNA polymerase-3 subunit delta
MSALKALLDAARARLVQVWVVVGDATPLVDEAVLAVERAALEKIRMPALNHQTVRGGEGQVMAALASARTLPMMDAARLVTVRECQDAPVEWWASLLAYAADPAPSTVLLVTGSGFPRASPKDGAWPDRLRKALGDRGRVALFSSADVPPVEFARGRAQSLGKVLGLDAARLLVEIAGADIRVLAGEVEKLSLYVGDAAEIDEAAIADVTSQLASGVIWDLTAAVTRRDRALALGAVAQLLDDGDDPRQLLGMLAWQFREILRYAELVRAGQSDSAIGRAVKLRPELQRAIRPRVGKDLPGAGVLMGRLARAWEEMNGHKAGDRKVLEALVLELTA